MSIIDLKKGYEIPEYKVRSFAQWAFSARLSSFSKIGYGKYDTWKFKFKSFNLYFTNHLLRTESIFCYIIKYWFMTIFIYFILTFVNAQSYEIV